MGANELFGFLIVLALVGFALYLIDRFVPMSPPVKLLFLVVAVVAVVVWLLSFLGIVPVFHGF